MECLRRLTSFHIWYEFSTYLFACWRVYDILRIFVLGPKHALANKLFPNAGVNHGVGRDAPYHRPYPGDAQTKCINLIPTPWAMTRALGLGVA